MFHRDTGFLAYRANLAAGLLRQVKEGVELEFELEEWLSQHGGVSWRYLERVSSIPNPTFSAHRPARNMTRTLNVARVPRVRERLGSHRSNPTSQRQYAQCGANSPTLSGTQYTRFVAMGMSVEDAYRVQGTD
jgi:hypothetical protein